MDIILRSSVETANDDGNIILLRTHEALRAASGDRRLLRLSTDTGKFVLCFSRVVTRINSLQARLCTSNKAHLLVEQ